MYNTEQHIRVFESLLKGGDWGEKLPDFMAAPGKDLGSLWDFLTSYGSFTRTENRYSTNYFGIASANAILKSSV